MPQLGCTRRGRSSSTDGRSWRSTGVSLAGQAAEPGPLPERLHDDDQVQPDVSAGPARPAPALGRAAARAVRRYGRAARPRPSWPCGCPSHRRAPRSHRSGHRGRRRGTRGHRTTDAWTLTEVCGQGDQGTTGIRTSGPPRRADRPLDAEPCSYGAAHAALGNPDGSTVRPPAGARDCRPYQGQLLGCFAGGQAAPRRTALLGYFGSSVEREAHGQVLWRVQMWRLA
jgi:hypothetical protein